MQDLWELGSDPKAIVHLIEKNIPVSSNTHMPDLACRKGAVCRHTAQAFGICMKGVDMIPEVMEYAEQKAVTYGVDSLYCFSDFYKILQCQSKPLRFALRQSNSKHLTPIFRRLKSNAYTFVESIIWQQFAVWD